MTRAMKDSGVEWIGEIPEDWEVVRLKNNYSVISGATPKSSNPEYWNGDLNWVTPADFKTDDMYINSTRRKITKKGLDSCGTEIVPVNSIVVSNRAPIGAISLTSVNLCTNQGCKSLISKNEQINKFTYYFMAVMDKVLNMLGRGTTFLELSTYDLNNFKYSLPSVRDQKKIANFLDKKTLDIDNIIFKTKEVIKEYKKYKQSLITEVVTSGLNKDVAMKDSGIEWIGKIPEHWEVRKLKYIFNIKKDIANELGYDVLSITQKGLRIRDLNSNEGQLSMDYSKYQIVNKNDFAMNHMDLLTGWVDLSKSLGVTSPDYRVFNIKNIDEYNNNYYLRLLQLCYTNRIFYGSGQGVSNLGRWRLQAEAFNNIYYPVPPINEQNKIATYLDKKCTQIDNIIQTKEKLLVEMEFYKKSLIYETVTGKREVN